jgi:hypothetical protein
MNPKENFQEQKVEEVDQKVHVLHTVNPLSKYLAMILFITLPFVGGWIGYNYAPEKVVEVERIVEVQKEAVDDIEIEPIMSMSDNETETERVLYKENTEVTTTIKTIITEDSTEVKNDYIYKFDNSDRLQEIADFESSLLDREGYEIELPTIVTDVEGCMNYDTDWGRSVCVHIMAYSTLDYDICFGIDYGREPIAVNSTSDEKGECLKGVARSITDVLNEEYDAPSSEIFTLMKPGLSVNYCLKNLSHDHDVKMCTYLSALVNQDASLCEEIYSKNASYTVEWENSCREEVEALSEIINLMIN